VKNPSSTTSREKILRSVDFSLRARCAFARCGGFVLSFRVRVL
jgi:hypothetical protein